MFPRFLHYDRRDMSRDRHARMIPRGTETPFPGTGKLCRFHPRETGEFYPARSMHTSMNVPTCTRRNDDTGHSRSQSVAYTSPTHCTCLVSGRCQLARRPLTWSAYQPCTLHPCDTDAFDPLETAFLTVSRTSRRLDSTVAPVVLSSDLQHNRSPRQTVSVSPYRHGDAGNGCVIRVELDGGGEGTLPTHRRCRCVGADQHVPANRALHRT